MQVTGAAARTGTYTLEDILKPHALEERIYRLRCVEAWSMVIPWVGFPLADLLKRFEPTSQAKYVQFFTLNDRAQMPGVRSSVLEWPYREGLTIAEAMHPLTFVAVGLYGKVLPNQNGAPYPHRHSVEIRLQELQVDRPHPLHGHAAADELEHGGAERVRLLLERQSAGRSSALEPSDGKAPRRRSVLAARIPTQMFNGYGEQVASLYTGLDLAQELLTRRGVRTDDASAGSSSSRWRSGRRAWRRSACSCCKRFGYAGGLGANPVEQVLNVCGKTGLNLLMLTLCITPIRRSTGINKLVLFRRLLGLFAFFYVCCIS